MNVHVLQHVPFEGLGSIDLWLAEQNAKVSFTKFFQSSDLPKISGLDLLIVLGGPMGVHDREKYPWLIEEKKFVKSCIEAKMAVLGICLGAQIIADVLGSQVYANAHKEIGWFPIDFLPAVNDSHIFHDFPEQTEVFHWHGETFDIPDISIHTSSSAACKHQSFVYEERVVGLQFHLEMTNAGIQQLLTNCSDELVSGPYIQSGAKMVRTEQCFIGINRLMHKVLTNMMFGQRKKGSF